MSVLYTMCFSNLLIVYTGTPLGGDFVYLLVMQLFITYKFNRRITSDCKGFLVKLMFVYTKYTFITIKECHRQMC